MKLLTENRRDFDLENPLAFPDYVKAFDKVKGTNCLKNYKAKYSHFSIKMYNRKLLRQQNKSIDKQLSD